MPKIPKSTNTPDAIRPYTFHGVELELPRSGKEALGQCPFCDKNQKFSVNIETSMFQCWGGGCGVQGNSTTFLKLYWDLCKQETTITDYQQLAEDSGFLKPHAARAFGVVMSKLKGQWLVPGYNHEGNLTGLYRYGRMLNTKKQWTNRLLVCPGTGVHLFNVPNYDPSKPIVDLCEGWRDGIAWYESITEMTINGRSLSNGRSVLAVPGTNAFKPQWCKFFAGKTVNIWFDNDPPNKNGQEGGGITGVKKVASILKSSSNPPEEVNYVAWNGEADQYSSDLPSSLDLRDHLKGVHINA